MLVILYLEAKNYLYDSRSVYDDHIYDGDVTTIKLVEQQEANNILNYLENKCEKIEDYWLFKSHEFIAKFKIHYKLITENLDPFVNFYSLKDVNPKKNCSINLYELIENEIKLENMEIKVAQISKLQNSDTKFYINYLQEQLRSIEEYYDSDNLFVFEQCIQNFWKHLNLKNLELGVLSSIISQYFELSNYIEVQNLNNETMKVYYHPQIGNFTYIQTSYLKYIFNNKGLERIDNISIDTCDGVFLDSKWDKYKKYEESWVGYPNPTAKYINEPL